MAPFVFNVRFDNLRAFWVKPGHDDKSQLCAKESDWCLIIYFIPVNE